MKIGDILFFAPGVRFDEVDLSAPELPQQFRRRIAGLYIEAAELCTQEGLAFAAGVLLVSCVDALARLRFGDGVRKRFKKFVVDELRSFSAGDMAERFYDEFRNGLVHEGRLKNGGQFSLETTATVQQIEGLLLVNPTYLAQEVRSALDAYVTLLESDGTERNRLANCLLVDLAKDFQTART